MKVIYEQKVHIPTWTLLIIWKIFNIEVVQYIEWLA